MALLQKLHRMRCMRSSHCKTKLAANGRPKYCRNTNTVVHDGAHAVNGHATQPAKSKREDDVTERREMADAYQGVGLHDGYSNRGPGRPLSNLSTNHLVFVGNRTTFS